MEDSGNYPKIIYLISGKRKSGKDYVSELLREKIGVENVVIIRLSAPIKSHWAKKNNLVLDDLLSSGSYKENYRRAMIEWGESMRQKDYGYFCKAAVEMLQDAALKPVWIISDIRRKTDLKWFYENYSNHTTMKMIRIIASDDVRKARGWIFEKGIDDAESECDLDSIDSWDLVICNGDDTSNFSEQFKKLISLYEGLIACQER